MPVEIKNINKIVARLKTINRRANHKKIRNKIANFLMVAIKDRTLKGEDFKGEKFIPYSVPYAKIRDKKGLPTGIVDLFFTGSMMSSMTYETSEQSIKLFFQSTRDKNNIVNAEKAFYLDENRNFFSLNVQDIKNIVFMYENYVLEE